MQIRMKLRNARLRKNISVPDLTENLDISASFYYKIEEGVRNPTIKLAKQIADKLGGTIDELFF